MSRGGHRDGHGRAEDKAAVGRQVGNVEDAVAQKECHRDQRVEEAQLKGGLRDDEHGESLLSGRCPRRKAGGRQYIVGNEDQSLVVVTSTTVPMLSKQE